MGSLENVYSFKKDSSFRSPASSSRNERNPFLQRTRSSFSRFLHSKKLVYLHCFCGIGVFLCFAVLLQTFLPGSIVRKSGNLLNDGRIKYVDFLLLKESGLLDFGEDIRFEPSNVFEKFKKEAKEANLYNAFNRTKQRFGHRNPQLALASIHQLLIFSPLSTFLFGERKNKSFLSCSSGFCVMLQY